MHSLFLATIPSDVSFSLEKAIFYMAICIVSEKERGRFSKQGCYQKSVGIALIDRCLFHYFKLLNQLDNSSTIYALERDNLLTVGKKNRNLMRTEVFPSGIKQGYSVNKMLFVSAFVFSSRTNKKTQTTILLPCLILSIQNITVLRPR